MGTHPASGALGVTSPLCVRSNPRTCNSRVYPVVLLLRLVKWGMEDFRELVASKLMVGAGVGGELET